MPPLSKRSKKTPLRLTNGDDDGSGYESMPVLLSVSDDETSSDDDVTSSVSGDPFSDYDESDDEEYDTDAEDELREQLKEAMNQAHQYDFYDSLREDERPPVVEDAEEKERKEKNSFLKLLGSLRGRMFSSSPKLKVPVGKGPFAARGVTVEDVDAASSASKKKKPKRKKKKKKTSAAGTGVGDGDGGDDTGADDEEEGDVADKAKGAATSPPASVSSPVGRSAVPVPITPPTSPSKKKKRRSSSTSTPLSPTSPTSPTSPHAHAHASACTGSLAGSLAPITYGSTTSLPLPQVEKAQSSHSYLKDALEKAKTKTKTRAGAGDGGLGPIDEKGRDGGKKKGFFGKWGLGMEGRDKSQDEDKDKDGGKSEKDKEEKEGNPFTKLSKKTKESLRVFFKSESPKGTLRWEQFLKIMAELGFEINPSTAGSSVRFRPANDKSITFHKPHPDSTLQPHHILAFGGRLRDQYGWSKEKLEKSLYAQAGGAGRG